MEFKILADASRKLSQFTTQRFMCDASRLIVLDGAAHIAEKLGAKCYTLIGDFDSITPLVLKQLSCQENIQVIDVPDQEHSDLDKGIMFCCQHDAKSIQIYNALGGDRVDHTILNLGLLKRFFDVKRQIIMFDKKQKIQYVHNAKVTIHGKRKQNVAVMPLHEALVHSSGLTYNMQNLRLRTSYRESSSNSLAHEVAYICIQGDSLIITDLTCDVKIEY
ncbi:thiamine pyrophosphokinase [Alphaproteobacteria bacterium]